MLLNSFSHIVFGTRPEPSDYLPFPYGGAFGPSSASVVLVPGETYVAYLAIDDPTFSISNMSVDLVREKTNAVVLSAVGALTLLDLSPAINHYTIQFQVPGNAAAMLSDYYRLVIHANAGDYYSNRLWLVNTDYNDMSAIFDYTNLDSIGPIDYTLPELVNFRNYLRLKCTASMPKTDTNIEQYRTETEGPIRTVENITNVYIPFSIDGVDFIGSDGWRSLWLHKIVKINGVSVSLKTGYQEQDNEGGINGNATFEVWYNKFSIANRC